MARSWYENAVRYFQGDEKTEAPEGDKKPDNEVKSASDKDSSIKEKVSTGRKKQIEDALKEAGVD